VTTLLRLATASLLAVAACSRAGSTPPPVVDPETPQVVPEPVVPAVWSWSAAMTGAWRLPDAGYSVAVVDEQRAVVTLLDERLVVVDLATGAVSEPSTILNPRAKIDQLARVGGRVIAFGEDAFAPAAWAITLDPVGATPLPYPDPGAGGPAYQPTRVVVSPDGTRVVVCGDDRWPVVRDVASLDVIAVAKDTECGDPRFLDGDTVAFGKLDETSHVLDLKTKQVALASPGGPTVYAGPRGRVATVSDTTLTITDGSGKILHTDDRRGRMDTAWLADGTFIEIGLGELAIHPGAGGVTRVVALPFLVPRVAASDRTIVVVSDYTVSTVDIATGELRVPEGNLSAPSQVAPRAGAVVVSADKLRVWRDGVQEAQGAGNVLRFAADPADQPIAVMSLAGVAAWDPANDTRRLLRPLDVLGFVLARDRDQLAYDDNNTIYRSVRGAAIAPWFRYASGMNAEAIDVTTNRVAWTRDKAYVVADLDRNRVWALQAWSYAGCDTGVSFKFARGTSRFAVESLNQIHLYDGATQKRLGGVELVDGALQAWDLVPSTGEVVMTARGEVIVWKAGDDSATSWASPFDVQASQVAVSGDGTEVAVGYVDGSVVWLNLAGVRKHGTPRAVAVHPRGEHPECLSGVAQPTLDDIIGAGDGEAAAVDPNCDDTNANVDDDCATVYGLPRDPEGP
jgi:hypothetical protein